MGELCTLITDEQIHDELIAHLSPATARARRWDRGRRGDDPRFRRGPA
jgi:hypothetical protein